MKRLIVRQQVLDCNKETCGKCTFLVPTFGEAGRYEDRNTCYFWNQALAFDVLSHQARRCYQCKNAETSK